MSEKEKMKKEELEQVAGGSDVLTEDGDHVCTKCGRTFTKKKVNIPGVHIDHELSIRRPVVYSKKEDLCPDCACRQLEESFGSRR